MVLDIRSREDISEKENMELRTQDEKESAMLRAGENTSTQNIKCKEHELGKRLSFQ